MANKKLDRVFDRVKLSSQWEEAMLADLLSETKEVAGMNKKRKISTTALAAAAVAAVLLAGTALAVAFDLPEILADWFGQRWEEKSGGAVEEGQMELFNRLTQPVGESDTVNGVTVTVDSVTVGDNTMWMLFVVDGLEGPLPEPGEDWEHMYRTGHDEWMIKPLEDRRFYGYLTRIHSAEVTEDGRLCLIASFTLQINGKPSFLDGCYGDCVIGEIAYGDQVLAKGPWKLLFITKPVKGFEYLTLDTAQFPATNGDQDILVEVEDVQISITGIHYKYQLDPACKTSQDYRIKEISLVLQDGTEVGTDFQIGEMGLVKGSMDEEYNLTHHKIENRVWPVPVDLDQIKALRVGDIEFPLQ